MKNLLAVIPVAAAIGILTIAFSAKADSDHPIFGNDNTAILVADGAAKESLLRRIAKSTKPASATEQPSESPGSIRKASDILQLPDIIVRPDSVDHEVATDFEGKAIAKEELS